MIDGIHSCGYHCDNPKCVKAQREYLLKENSILRAENARQRAWIDGVMAQKVVDAVDIGTACANLRMVDTRHREIDDAMHDIEVRSVKTILRPAPFEDK